MNPVSSNRILIWDLLHRSCNALGRDEDKIHRRTKLTPAQFDILFALSNLHNPVTVNSLSHYLYRSSNSVTMILDRMEAAGLVKRKRNLSDRRATRVAMTSAGKLRLKETRPVLEELMKDITRDFSDEDLIGFKKSLEKICGNGTRPAARDSK